MRLRSRIIVALLIVSVVPLGAVTYYSYTSQVRALREVASREADALSTDMTQRMKLVTSELSSRVEQLVDMTPVATPRPTQPRTAKPAAQVATANPAPASAASASSAPNASDASTTRVALTDASVSEALGAAAMLLRSVELQGLRRGGGSRPPGDPGRGVSQNDQRSPDGSRSTRPQPGEGRGGRPPRPGGSPVPPAALTTV